MEGADADRPGGGGDHVRDRRGVRAGRLHARHARPVLQRVRPHRRGGGAVLAAGGAPADAADGRLLPRSRSARQATPQAAAASTGEALEWALDHRSWRRSIIGDDSVLRARSCSSCLLPSGFQPAGQSELPRASRSRARRARRSSDMERSSSRSTTLLAAQPEGEAVFVAGRRTAARAAARGGVATAGRHEGNGHADPEGTSATRGSARSATACGPKLREIPDARLTFVDRRVRLRRHQHHPDQRDPAKGSKRPASSCERQMRTLAGLVDPRPATPPSGPELVIRPKPDEAARLGVSVDVIARPRASRRSATSTPTSPS